MDDIIMQSEPKKRDRNQISEKIFYNVSDSEQNFYNVSDSEPSFL